MRKKWPLKSAFSLVCFCAVVWAAPATAEEPAASEDVLMAPVPSTDLDALDLPDETPATVTTPNESPATDPDSQDESNSARKVVPFVLLESGINGGTRQDEPQAFLIQTPADWGVFWKMHAAAPRSVQTTAGINYQTQSVLAVVDSDQPNSGYSLRLDRIEQQKDELWVYATREQPGPDCLNLGSIAQPFLLATIHRTTLKPKLILSTHVYRCE